MDLPNHVQQNAPTNYKEYLETPEGDRWEIIEGVPYNMSPMPSIKHQTITTNFLGLFSNYLKGKDCKVFPPIDVCLFVEDKTTNEEINCVVQPDISIICDKSKLDQQTCKGAPDLVVEILSPSTWRHDKERKLHLYRRAGVKEYWIVDPKNDAIDVYQFEKVDNFPNIKAHRLNDHDEIKVGIFDDLVVKLGDIFEG